MYLPEEIKEYVNNMNCIKDSEGKSKADVYRFFDVDKEYYLKVEKRNEETVREHAMYQWLKGKLPVPQIICESFDKGVDYMLVEKVKGVTLDSEGYSSNPERLVKVAAEGLNLLWKVPISDCPYDASIEKKLKIAEDKLDEKEEIQVDQNIYTAGLHTGREVYEYLLAHMPEEDKVFTHGDYCFNNYFAEDNHISGFIDMGRGGVGDRYQDIALCVRGLMKYEKRYTDLLFNYLKLEPNYEKIKYYILLDELF